MRREDRILKEFYRDEVRRVKDRELPTEELGVISCTGRTDKAGKVGPLGADLLWVAALVAIVLVPHVVKLPPPSLAVRTSDAYRQYLQQPSALRAQTQTFVNSLKSYFGEE